MISFEWAKPEVSPIHTINKSIAFQLKPPVGTPLGSVIPAGTLLKGDFASRFVSYVSKMDRDEPNSKCLVACGVDENHFGMYLQPTFAEVATADDASEITGVLVHSVVVPCNSNHDTRVPVGVMLGGVVYRDIMLSANGKENYTDESVDSLGAIGITEYGAKTLEVNYMQIRLNQ